MSSESDRIEIEWFVTQDTIGTGLAVWKRTFGIDSTGVVFIPVGVFLPETVAVLLAPHDGIGVAMCGEHAYIPSETIASWCPGVADRIRKAAVNMKASVK
jgi:hypothetical protein